MLKARIKFQKIWYHAFHRHLDVMRFFQKAMRRANIPIAFTGGYSPHMIMSFAQPLGVGLTSDGEYLDIELTESISSEDAVRQLNEVSVEGIEILSFVQISDEKKASGMTIVAAARYEITCLESKKSAEVTKNIPFDWNEKITDFLKQSEIMVLKKTKKNEREINIRPLIYEMNVSEEHIQMLLAAGSEENLKPDLVMQAFLQHAGANSEETPLHYHRVDVYSAGRRRICSTGQPWNHNLLSEKQRDKKTWEKKK